MIDHIKLICDDQQIINRLRGLPELKPYRHRINTYDGLHVPERKINLEFRKSFSGGVFVGYSYVALSVSPHYHLNGYLHNGNDLTPQNAVISLIQIFASLSIKETEFDRFAVVNLEFGLNLIPQTDIKKIVAGISFYKKTPFRVSGFEFNKITDATKQKQIKAYAKGLQFAEFPQYGIAANTFRFEVRNKKSAPIRRHGIRTAKDLVKLSIYKKLGQTLIDEWMQVLILDTEPDFAPSTREEIRRLKKYCSLTFWQQTIAHSSRNKYSRERKKYYSILQKLSLKPTVHDEVLSLIYEKIFSFGNGAYLPQKNHTTKTAVSTINKSKTAPQRLNEMVQVSPHARVVNGKNAPPAPDQPRRCIVTGLDISMQKNDSKFLFSVGLRYYQTNDPKNYDEVLRRFWSSECRGKGDEELHRIIAHNIRNNYNNNRYRQQREILHGQTTLF